MQNSVSEELPRDPVIEAVRADLLRRQQLGYRKYGGTLAANPAPLRGALQHAYEEALDLCNYLQWSMMQLDGSPELTPDETHNTGLAHGGYVPPNPDVLTTVQRDKLARQIQQFVENYDPKLLANVSLSELQDELHRRQQAILGDPRERVTVQHACAHGLDPEECDICKSYEFG